MKPRRVLIGVAGPSCSGKTTVAEALAQLLDASVVAADRYYRDLSHLSALERDDRNFDHPEAVDHELLRRHLEALCRGHAVDSPEYDFVTHTRLPQTRRIESRSFVVVEGLYILHWRAVRDLLSLALMLQADHDTCLERRLLRDCLERGRAPAFVRAQYERDVRPMCDRYLVPSGRYAHIVLDGTLPIDSSVEAALRAVREFLGRDPAP